MSDISIDARIMDILARKSACERLAKKVMIDRKKVIYDDRDYNGGGDTWYTTQKAWNSISESATHGMVMHGDIDVVNDFWKYAYKCVERHPEAIWTFCWWGRITSAMEKLMKKTTSPYVRIKGGSFTTQCVVIPRRFINDMMRIPDEIWEKDFIYDDVRMRFTALHLGIPVYSTLPCLVQHEGGREGMSTYGFKGFKEPRYNRFYNKNVEEWDWDAESEGTVTCWPFLCYRGKNIERVKQFCDAAIKKEREKYGERKPRR